jgi:hypothetical protein
MVLDQDSKSTLVELMCPTTSGISYQNQNLIYFPSTHKRSL